MMYILISFDLFDMMYLLMYIDLWIVMIPSSCWCTLIVWYDMQGHLGIIIFIDLSWHVSVFFFRLIWVTNAWWYDTDMLIYDMDAFYFDDIDALIRRSTWFWCNFFFMWLCVMMWFVWMRMIYMFWRWYMPLWWLLILDVYDMQMSRCVHVMNKCPIVKCRCDVDM